jgi:hypothetical protein
MKNRDRMVGSSSIKVLMFLLFLGASYAAAQDSFKPANFNESDRSLQHKIEFPEVTEDVDVLVKCITTVSRSGEMLSGRTRRLQSPTYLMCLDYREENRDFFDAVRLGLESTLITPAEVDERRLAVIFSFAIRFTSVAGSQELTVYANHGSDDRFPMEGFIQSQIYRDRVERACARGREVNVEYQYTVTVEGLGSVDSFIESENGLGTCEDNLTRGIELARFIPGHFNDEPVESVAISYFYDSSQCGNTVRPPRPYCYLDD